jgi:predicted RNase H-like HicB family nuclease
VSQLFNQEASQGKIFLKAYNEALKSKSKGEIRMENFTAIFESAEEGGYIGWIEEIPEAMSQGETLDEVKANLLDALKLVLEVNREQAENDLYGRDVIREMIPIAAV